MLKRTGLILSLLVGLVWASAIPWNWYFHRWVMIPAEGYGTLQFILSAQRGSLCYVYRDIDSTVKTEGVYWGFVRQTDLGPLWWPVHKSVVGLGEWIVPLWIPFLLVTAPTALLWWRDRRRPRGHCQHCGYDLTGNTRGVCPECGQPIEPPDESTPPSADNRR